MKVPGRYSKKHQNFKVYLWVILTWSSESEFSEFSGLRRFSTRHSAEAQVGTPSGRVAHHRRKGEPPNTRGRRVVPEALSPGIRSKLWPWRGQIWMSSLRPPGTTGRYNYGIILGVEMKKSYPKALCVLSIYRNSLRIISRGK